VFSSWFILLTVSLRSIKICEMINSFDWCLALFWNCCLHFISFTFFKIKIYWLLSWFSISWYRSYSLFENDSFLFHPKSIHFNPREFIYFIFFQLKLLVKSTISRLWKWGLMVLLSTMLGINLPHRRSKMEPMTWWGSFFVSENFLL